MGEFVANLIVVLIVAVSACYAFWRLAPVRAKNALRRWLGIGAGSQSSSACDACGGCDLAKGKRR